MIHDDNVDGARPGWPVMSLGEGAHDWRERLPVLSDGCIRLRELSRSDAPSLLTVLGTEEVSRFISPPPTNVAELERFIGWTQRERAAGTQACFGIVPRGYESAIGLIQVRQLAPRFDIAEWGFVVGLRFWGTGAFMDSAGMVLDFAFRDVGVRRLEARAAVPNVRGNGALRKLGAVHEGTLRRSLRRQGTSLDQNMWSILAEDWLRAKAVWSETVH